MQAAFLWPGNRAAAADGRALYDAAMCMQAAFLWPGTRAAAAGGSEGRTQRAAARRLLKGQPLRTLAGKQGGGGGGQGGGIRLRLRDTLLAGSLLKLRSLHHVPRASVEYLRSCVRHHSVTPIATCVPGTCPNTRRAWKHSLLWPTWSWNNCHSYSVTKECDLKRSWFDDLPALPLMPTCRGVNAVFVQPSART